jgi:hypothetical protein
VVCLFIAMEKEKGRKRVINNGSKKRVGEKSYY